jgi:hypothetical protein
VKVCTCRDCRTTPCVTRSVFVVNESMYICDDYRHLSDTERNKFFVSGRRIKQLVGPAYTFIRVDHMHTVRGRKANCNYDI